MTTVTIIRNGQAVDLPFDDVFPSTVPSVPQVVSRRQAKLALLAAGLLAGAEAAITAAGPAAQIEWADAQEFRRDHPLIEGVGTALELDSEAIDDLFRAAAAL